jgi:putative tryptophan/tyrosine transport system substrate-binding protein
MTRREFITLLGGTVAAWPLAARAQQPKVPRIGFLGLAPASAQASRLEALRSGLRELGYVDGKNIVLELRWADGVDQLARLATEFVRINVDIIFAQSSTMVEPARQATKTIPIVFATHADPVGIGHVASLARPGGNITGMSMLLTELAAKQLEIFKEALPGATRVGTLWNPTTPSHYPALEAVQVAARRLEVRLIEAPAANADDIDGALGTMVRERADGLIVVTSPLAYSQRILLADLALRHRLASMFGDSQNVEAGGLMSYAADSVDLFRRSAFYIDKILKGAKPADLPVDQATKFQLVINMKTTKALGIELPPTLIARADEVIE